MPRFIDQHPSDPNPSPEMIAFIMQRLQSGEPDEFGERGINVFVGPAGRSAIQRHRLPTQ